MQSEAIPYMVRVLRRASLCAPGVNLPVECGEPVRFELGGKTWLRKTGEALQDFRQRMHEEARRIFPEGLEKHTVLAFDWVER